VACHVVISDGVLCWRACDSVRRRACAISRYAYVTRPGVGDSQSAARCVRRPACHAPLGHNLTISLPRIAKYDYSIASSNNVMTYISYTLNDSDNICIITSPGNLMLCSHLWRRAVCATASFAEHVPVCKLVVSARAEVGTSASATPLLLAVTKAFIFHVLTGSYFP